MTRKLRKFERESEVGCREALRAGCFHSLWITGLIALSIFILIFGAMLAGG